MSRRAALLLAAVVFVVGSWGTALAILPLGALATSLSWTAVALAAMFASRTTAARAVWFNVAFVMAATGVFEAAIRTRAVSEQKQQTFSNSTDLFTLDDTLGVRPAPGLHTTAKMTYGGRTVYDVTYSFDEHGLRISPPDERGFEQPCVLFFGGSFTFGEGVEDDEAMPYRAGVRAAGRAAVRNFGFSGYGPHQMLAAIESGFVEEAARCTPRWAVYQAVYHHVLRAAGAWTWVGTGLGTCSTRPGDR